MSPQLLRYLLIVNIIIYSIFFQMEKTNNCLLKKTFSGFSLIRLRSERKPPNNGGSPCGGPDPNCTGGYCLDDGDN
ncbi:hypothetical protein HWI79_3744 [Cryptosporidium felis]|nr:hypothetical protein HWI79_3744 [Cryptosporidium felis]